jgi:hypothetical protein
LALIKLGPTVGQISGSVGGVTFSRNAGGAYIRTRAIPVNPGSQFQTELRGYLAQLTALWPTLSEAIRDGWDAYSENVLLPNPLGDQRKIGALAHYVRSNVSRLQAGLPRVDTAPVIFTLGDFTQPEIVTITAPQALSLAFTDTDDWVGEDDSGLLIYGARGYNPTINYFKGPDRWSDIIPGNGTTPETSPFAADLPFVLQAEQKSFIFGRVSRADGRLSSPFRLPGIVAAA